MEFTYNAMRNQGRGEDEAEAADCFTEVDINTSFTDDIKNVSTKSIILAPFNTTFKDE